jgi:hypothetical protein
MDVQQPATRVVDLITESLEPDLQRRLRDVQEDGKRIWAQFEADFRRDNWHPFFPADYDQVLESLLPLRQPGLRFLEWGSATGVIAIMADILGFESCGIEIDANLVVAARALAARHDSGARFATGSFMPAGYEWISPEGDPRLGTIGDGEPGYAELGLELDAFDIVFVYPWPGEEPIVQDIMRKRGRPGARLMLNAGRQGIRILS